MSANASVVVKRAFMQTSLAYIDVSATGLHEEASYLTVHHQLFLTSSLKYTFNDNAPSPSGAFFILCCKSSCLQLRRPPRTSLVQDVEVTEIYLSYKLKTEREPIAEERSGIKQSEQAQNELGCCTISLVTFGFRQARCGIGIPPPIPC